MLDSTHKDCFIYSSDTCEQAYRAAGAEEYVVNCRGKPDHSFLINSKNGRPLSTEGVTKIFQKITASLPKHLRKLLVGTDG
jgi:hypothetical protein